MVFHFGLSNLRTRTSSSCPLRVDLKVFFFLFGNLEGWFLDVFQDKIWFMMVYEFVAFGYIFEGQLVEAFSTTSSEGHTFTEKISIYWGSQEYPQEMI